MPYSERAYFDGDHCQHCADHDEQHRLQRIRKQSSAMLERRRGSRSIFASQPALRLV